jgi:hypothetical protein
MAQARTILGFGGSIIISRNKQVQRQTCMVFFGVREEENVSENVRISQLLLLVGFLGSGLEAVKILSLSLSLQVLCVAIQDGVERERRTEKGVYWCIEFPVQ